MFSQKNAVRKTKRQATDGEKIFTKYVSNKGLVSRLYVKCSKSSEIRKETP